MAVGRSATAWIFGAAIALAVGCGGGSPDAGTDADTSGDSGTATGETETETDGEETDTGESETGTDEDETDTGDDTDEEEDPDAWWCNDPDVPIADLESAVVIDGWGDFYGDFIFVEVSSDENECTVWQGYPACGGKWRISIGLPPEAQKPGVYDTGHPDIESYVRISFEGDPCGHFTNAAMPGALRIISIDDEKVVGRLCNVPRGWGHDMNGTFTAYRCQ